MKQRIDNQTDEEAHIWFDEFSVSTRPQASHAWAEKNISPTIPSDEKKRKRENGLLAVENEQGITHLDTQPKANAQI